MITVIVMFANGATKSIQVLPSALQGVVRELIASPQVASVATEGPLEHPPF
jgi:hypothetical protein